MEPLGGAAHSGRPIQSREPRGSAVPSARYRKTLATLSKEEAMSSNGGPSVPLLNAFLYINLFGSALAVIALAIKEIIS